MKTKYPLTMKYLESLNSLYSVPANWRIACANKAHIDNFGIKIKRGEEYYTSGYYGTPSFQRLSKQSMENLVLTVIHCNDMLYMKHEELAQANAEAGREYTSGMAESLERHSA